LANFYGISYSQESVCFFSVTTALLPQFENPLYSLAARQPATSDDLNSASTDGSGVARF